MLLNREALLSALFCETDRAQRMKTPLGLILFQIDDHDGWRSRLGKSAYDAAVGEIVGRIQQILRCYDSLGQIADGEFVLVLPGCNSSNAATMAERLETEVFSAPLTICNEEVHFTACSGVVASGGRTPFVVLREAELLLRSARTRGAGSIERCASDAEPDPSEFLIPVVESR